MNTFKDEEDNLSKQFDCLNCYDSGWVERQSSSMVDFYSERCPCCDDEQDRQEDNE